MSRVDTLQTILTEAFQPSSLEIIDESDKHAGHAGSAGGGGHFLVYITSAHFDGKSRIQMHRMINQATTQLFGNTIHALSIHAQGENSVS